MTFVRPNPPRHQGRTRFVCISDTHFRHREMPAPLPPGDVLLHCGDGARIPPFFTEI